MSVLFPWEITTVNDAHIIIVHDKYLHTYTVELCAHTNKEDNSDYISPEMPQHIIIL